MPRARPLPGSWSSPHPLHRLSAAAFVLLCLPYLSESTPRLSADSFLGRRFSARPRLFLHKIGVGATHRRGVIGRRRSGQHLLPAFQIRDSHRRIARVAAGGETDLDDDQRQIIMEEWKGKRAKDIKAELSRLDISAEDCFEKSDLLSRLVDGIARMARGEVEATTSHVEGDEERGGGGGGSGQSRRPPPRPPQSENNDVVEIGADVEVVDISDDDILGRRPRGSWKKKAEDKGARSSENAASSEVVYVDSVMAPGEENTSTSSANEQGSTTGEERATTTTTTTTTTTVTSDGAKKKKTKKKREEEEFVESEQVVQTESTAHSTPSSARKTPVGQERKGEAATQTRGVKDESGEPSPGAKSAAKERQSQTAAAASVASPPPAEDRYASLSMRGKEGYVADTTMEKLAGVEEALGLGRQKDDFRSNDMLVIHLDLPNSIRGKFLIDTAASCSLLSKEAMRSLGSCVKTLDESGEEVPLPDSYKDEDKEGYRVIINQLSMDGTPLGGLSPFVMSERSLLPFKVDGLVGILGLDFLSRFDVDLDFKSSKISLFQPGMLLRHNPSIKNGKQVDLPLKIGPNGVLMTEVSLFQNQKEGPMIPAIIDTGMSYSIMNWQAANLLGARKDGSGGVRPTGAMVTGVDGQPETVSEAPIGVRFKSSQGSLAPPLQVSQRVLCVGDIALFDDMGLGTSPVIALGMDVLSDSPWSNRLILSLALERIRIAMPA